MSSQVLREEPQEFRLGQALIGWTTLVLVLLSVLALGANRPVSWTLLSMAVLVLFILQILLDALTGVHSRAGRIWPWALAYIAVLAWGYVQIAPDLMPGLAHPIWAIVPDAPTTISADPLGGQHHVMRLAMYGMVFWIIARAAITVDRALLFLKLFAVFCTALAAFGLFSWATGNNVILGEDAQPALSASFVNRNSYATFAAFGAIANVALYLQLAEDRSVNDGPAGKRLRDFIEGFYGGGWIFVVGILLCLGSIFISASRAGSAAAILGIAAFLVVNTRGENSRNPLVLGMIGAIFLFAIFALSSGLLNRLLATSEEDGRFQIYGEVFQGIFDRPLLGHGLGAFHDTFRARVPLDAANVEWNLAHSSYLENFYELGLPAAALLYLSLFGIGAVILRGCIQRRRHRIFAAVAFGVLVAGAFHSFFDFSLQMPATAATFAALLGIGWAQAFRRERTRR